MIRPREFAIDLKTPLLTAKGGIKRREGLLATVDVVGETDVDEVTSLLGWTESLGNCHDALAGLTKDDVEGAVVDDPRSMIEDGALADASAARHAVSLTTVDARTCTAGQPLITFLATDPHTSLPVNATLGDDDPEAIVEAAETAAESGYGCLRLKVGAQDPTGDVTHLRTVREVVGPDVALRTDVNIAWGCWAADCLLDSVEELGLGFDYLEQLSPVDEFDGHAVL